ncbi:flagellar basal body P-ring formation chaperone FlgA [Falsiroseomonas sp. HW251]|uniref:flagellar basal body P-ring formation chaperone FlgA n=1 Tax=Falsiroseomonas sp. HW251 TaxID=3390998 RepID=UPI003D3103BE
MRWLVLAFALLAAPARGELATLRPFAVVDDAVVRLSDLFDNAGPRAAVVLGPAPAPGGRQVIETAQIAAIARANGIAWRPVGGGERVVLERPGRQLSRDEIVLALRGALRGQGLEEEAELEIQAFAPPMVPERAFVQLAVEGAVLDLPGARFAATLAIVAEGMPTQRVRLAGRVVATVPVLVATRRLALGEVMRAQDVRQARIPAGRLRPGSAQEPEQVVGQALRRPAAADQPIMLADLSTPLAIERGQTVTMIYDIPGMALTAQGRAMEGAPRGASLPVMNLVSRVVVEAQVVGPGRVRVGSLR